MQSVFMKPSGSFGAPNHRNPDAEDDQNPQMGFRPNAESSSKRLQTFDVYVCNIPQDWTEERLMDLFAPYGDIKSVQFRDNPEFRNYKKIAFVRFSREDQARKAVEALNRYPTGNSVLQMNMATRGKFKDRQCSGEFNQGRKTYGDFKKNNPNSFEGHWNERGHNWNSNKTDYKRGKPGGRQFGRMPSDNEYGGGYSNTCSNPSHGYGPSSYGQSRTAWEQQPGHGFYGDQRKDWKSNVKVSQRSILREETLLVTEVESSVAFWGQVGIASVAHSLAKASDELQTYCPTGPKVTSSGQIQQNKVYGGVYPCDNLWYRCTVLQFLPEGLVKVKFIDYGNVESIEQEGLVDLPSTLSEARPFAHLYHLADCTTTTDPAAVMTDPLAFEQLKNLINGRLVNVKVVSEGGGMCEVTIEHPEDPAKTVNEVMIAGGCVQRVRRNSGGRIERSVAEKPLNDDHKDTSDLQNRKNFKQENDNLRKTIKIQSETICNLNKLYETVKQQNDEFSQEQHHTLNDKVKRVLSIVANLNQTRHSSASGHKNTKVIEDGIFLVTDSANRLTLEHVDTFRELCFSSDALRFAQDSIRNCKESLDEQIQKRNKIKQELFENIKNFLTEVSALDLDEREEKLKKALSNLNVFHQRAEGEEPLIEKAIDNYRDWKANQFNQIDNIHNATDGASSRLAAEFGKLQKLLDPSVNFSLDDCGALDLDSISAEFNEAVSTETQQTQVGDDRENMKIISALITALKKEIRHEISDIIQLRTSAEEYNVQQVNLEKWLHNEPDVSNVLNVRKNLKSVKSKFRHKQADRKDLEEGDDKNDDEELKKVEEDLVELRSHLHKLLSEEKEAMEELSPLASEYFPELPLQYAEFGLEKFMETNGLVKQGWELNYYSHREMAKVSTFSPYQVAFLTTFNSEPCALKEFNLEEIADVDLFESRAVAYSKVDNPNLLQLQALFYDKTNRKAFIQLPYHETNLKTWLSTSQSDKSKRAVIHDILRALNSLHQAGITHGSVVGENIFVDPDTGGILGEYCFVNDTENRVASTAEVLLKNASPISCEASPVFDMYCLGEIACQVFFGDVPLTRDINSLQNLSQSKELTSMLAFLLALNGGSRPTASQVLEHPFFKDTCLFGTEQPEPLNPGAGANEQQKQSNETLEINEEREQKETGENNQALKEGEGDIKELDENGESVVEEEKHVGQDNASGDDEENVLEDKTLAEEKVTEEDKTLELENTENKILIEDNVVSEEKSSTEEKILSEEKVLAEEDVVAEESVVAEVAAGEEKPNIVNSEETEISPEESMNVEGEAENDGLLDQVDIPDASAISEQPLQDSPKTE